MRECRETIIHSDHTEGMQFEIGWLEVLSCVGPRPLVRETHLGQVIGTEWLSSSPMVSCHFVPARSLASFSNSTSNRLILQRFH